MTLPAIGFECQGHRPLKYTRAFETIPSLDAAVHDAVRRYANGMPVVKVEKDVHPSAMSAVVVYITCRELWTKGNKVAVSCKVKGFL